MIIIVEGIDRVGKTTLCNKLSKELGIKIFKDNPVHYSSGLKEVYTEKVKTLVNMQECFNNDFISDRLHLTEYVYGFCEREYCNMEMFNVDEQLSKMDCILILVTPVYIERSSKEHGKDLKLHSILMDTFYRRSKIKNKFRIMYEDFDSITEEVRKIVYGGM
jgi:thymidylate kinase